MRIWPAFLFVAAAFGQGQFHVAGIVANSTTGDPVRQALVIAEMVPTRPDMPPKSVAALSDATGAFRVEGLGAGKYYIHAEKPGWAAARLAADAIELGPSVDRLALRLDPLAKIHGTVADQEGEPVGGAAVRLFRSRIDDGRRVIARAQSVNADGSGNYRMWNIEPGEYYVVAAGRGGGTSVVVGEAAAAANSHESFTPVYFGDAKTPVVLAAGQELEATFRVSMRPAYQVQGRLRNARQYQSARIELLRDGQDVSAARARVDGATGQFTIQGVVPGSYVLRATQQRGSETLRGETKIEVGERDVEGVEIELAPPVEVFIRTQVQGRERPGWCGGWLHGEDGADLDVKRTQDADLTITKVFPGRYRLRFVCLGGHIISAMAGNVDLLPTRSLEVTAGPLAVEIVASTEGGTVTGAADGGFVVLVPVGGVESELVPAHGGVYAFYGVAPGDYELYVLRSTTGLEFRNSEVMRKLGRGAPVRVDKGATVTVDLKEAGR